MYPHITKPITAFGRSIESLRQPMLSILLVVGFLAAGQHAFAGWEPDKLSDARQAVSEFKKADPSLKRLFNSAYAYAVFPTVGKGGIGIGGAYGSGIVFIAGHPTGETSLTQLTIGFQLGGQAYREIIFFRDKATLAGFKHGSFELSAQASAVAATLGASADADFENGVAVFTLAKGGLMYEASVGGQKFSFDSY